MKQVRNAFLIAVSAIIASGCMAVEPNQQTSLTTLKTGIVQGNNKFALELYGRLNDTQGNLFLSPYSISTALAMTYAGARGTTGEQMAKTLQFPGKTGNEQFHREFGAIIQQLNAEGEKGGFELVIANALWGQKDYKFLSEFLSLVRTNYGGDLQQVDFAKQTEDTRKTINTWVEDKTKDKIKELLKPGVLDSRIRLVLTNAIYFKGKWASQFKPDLTKDAPFTLLSGEKTRAPMMNQKGDFGYNETDTIQALELPYVNNDLSMVILLPKKLDGVKDLDKELTSDNLAGWLGKMRKREVQVFVPRFKTTSEFSLGETLGAMGMPEAFSTNADFSGMTGSRDLFISAVVHKAFVNVDEEGTEAAAATGVVMKLTSVGALPPVFRADHPFVFLIRDNLTGSILFLGRIVKPASQDN